MSHYVEIESHMYVYMYKTHKPIESKYYYSIFSYLFYSINDVQDFLWFCLQSKNTAALLFLMPTFLFPEDWITRAFSFFGIQNHVIFSCIRYSSNIKELAKGYNVYSVLEYWVLVFVCFGWIADFLIFFFPVEAFKCQLMDFFSWIRISIGWLVSNFYSTKVLTDMAT